MESAETVAMYALIYAPLFSLPVLAGIVFFTLPLIAFIGRKIGNAEHRRWKFDPDKPGRIPGGTSLGAMLAHLWLLLGFAFSAGLGWRDSPQTALVWCSPTFRDERPLRRAAMQHWVDGSAAALGRKRPMAMPSPMSVPSGGLN